MSRLLFRVSAVLLFLTPTLAWAQGVLIVVDPHEHVRLPRPIIIWPPPHPHPHPHPIPIPHPRPIPPPATYKIEKLDVQAKLVDQVAQVQMSQSFVNTGSRQMEVSFVFPLPYDGAIEQMTLMVDGKEYSARLLDAKEARKMYEEIVRKNKDPALLEWMGAGLFKTSVFPVPAGAKRTVSLRYSQLCRKAEGLTDFLFPLSTAKYTSHAVEEVNIRVTVESGIDIKNIYSPTHKIKIKRPDDRHATVTYNVEKEVPSSDFRLLYGVNAKKVGTQVLSYRPDNKEDGFFLLLASPQIKAADEKPAKKTVLFVVDRSGSMSGKKIEQARGAAKFVLNNLNEGDLFNIVAYDSQIESFQPELQRYDDATRKKALGFIEGLYAGGSTNIDQALNTALSQLQDSKSPNYVIFLTDGLPTAGETNEMKIVDNAKKENRVRARIFTFGVGYDVNSRLLDRLVRANFGQGEYVRPDEDIEERVSRFYGRIKAPVMTDVSVKFVVDEKDEEGKSINRVYPEDAFDLFAGEQLVVVGRYKKPGDAKVTVAGRIGKNKESFDFPAKLVKKSSDDTNAFVEKLWAVRRIGEILDEIDLSGKNDELVEELVKLSTRHGILTPYTAFMADENTRVHDLAANTARTDLHLGALSNSSGAGGFMQREAKARFKAAGQGAAAPSAPGKYYARGSFDQALRSVPGAKLPAATMPRPAGRPSVAGPGMGYGGGRIAGQTPRADGDELSSEEAVAAAVRNVGNKTFFRRAERWVDSSVTESQEKNVQQVKQFSREYFDLARRFGQQFSQYLVFDETVVVEFEGQAYEILPEGS